MLLITNSRRARPTPQLGSAWKSNARFGLPMFMVIFTGHFGNSPWSREVTSISRMPVDIPGVPFGTGNGAGPAVLERGGGVAAPHHGGNARLAGDEGGG